MLQLLFVIGLQIALASFFIYYVIHNDHGQKEPKTGINAAISFGLIALIITAVVTTFIKTLPGLNEVTDLNRDAIQAGTIDITYLFLAAMLIGVVEETAKALPLALFIYKKPYFNELTDGILYFGITGIVFGLAESIIYTLMSGAGVGLMRIIITPFLHAGFSMWFGYALARYKLHIGGLTPVLFAFVGSMVLHGLYDFGLFTGSTELIIGSLMLALSLNVGVFLMYRHAQKIDAKLVAAGLEDKPNLPTSKK
ncbi:MAG: protease PrsW [Patescibacteria group bacterium]|nr:protease PrsW [Patescibacteria group bacterium]